MGVITCPNCIQLNGIWLPALLRVLQCAQSSSVWLAVMERDTTQAVTASLMRFAAGQGKFAASGTSGILVIPD